MFRLFMIFCKDCPLPLIGLPVLIRSRGVYGHGFQQVIGATPAVYSGIRKNSTSPDREHGKVANVVSFKL